MGTSFLYWNIDKKKGFEAQIAQVCNMPEVKADILLLVEAENVDDKKVYAHTKLKRVRIEDAKETELTPRFYSKLDIDSFQFLELHDSSRLIFARLNKEGEKEIIIGGVHLPSKLNGNDKETQYKYARQIAAFVKDLETRDGINNNNLFLFGDFNMNPFEPGMIEPDAFNATLSTVEAKNESRTHWFKEYDYFYNPMWSHLGDRDINTGSLKLPGSYYFRKTLNVGLTYWNVYDKVIMRPSIIDTFDFKSIKFIDFNGIEKLVEDDFRIRDEAYSDHLPLTFKLLI